MQRRIHLSQNRRLRSVRDLQFSPIATIPLFPIYNQERQYQFDLSVKRNIENKLKNKTKEANASFLHMERMQFSIIHTAFS